MDNPNTNRGNYGNPNNVAQGRGRGFYNNNRGQFRGSPPRSASNSSYQGSPHSNPSYQSGRGGWNGPQHMQGNSASPPYRQNSFPGAGQSQEQYFQSQLQQRGGHSQRGGSGFRGGRGGNRGGRYQQHPPQDARHPGPDEQDSQASYRGRGGHYNNLQWTASGPKRGGGAGLATGANSIQPSAAPSQQASRDSFEPPSEDGSHFRQPREQQQEDDRNLTSDVSQPPKGNNHPQNHASKFSFAFKSKAPQQPQAKDVPDKNQTHKGPSHQADINRPPPTQPKGKQHDKKGRHFDRNDRKHDFHNERRAGPPPQHPHRQQQQPHVRPHEQRQRSRSPPAKRLKQEPKARPRLSAEMAASESIYFRKPGNESVVGAGTYGKVFKAVHIYTKDEVALKKIRMEGERDGFPITAVREIKLLQHLRHKHVVALQEVMVEKNECFMVFEYMSHDLTGLINHPFFTLTAAHKKNLAQQMFDGLDFLHRRGVLHRDIKAANILISSSGQLKYADFGLARFYTKSRKLDYTNRVITIWYRPPELLLGETQYGPAVDIWSAACVFMEMFTKKAVFPGEGGELSQLERVYNVLGTPTRTEWPSIVDLPWFELMQPSERRKRVFESTFENVLSSAAMSMVQDMFKYDPNDRPSAEDVLKHVYFTEEEPGPVQATELEQVGGDWHEYESKAHRRENDKKERERKKEEHVREREKRKAKEAGIDGESGVDSKKARSEGGENHSKDDLPEVSMDDRAEESEGEGSARMSMS